MREGQNDTIVPFARMCLGGDPPWIRLGLSPAGAATVACAKTAGPPVEHTGVQGMGVRVCQTRCANIAAIANPCDAVRRNQSALVGVSQSKLQFRNDGNLVPGIIC